MIYWCQIKLNKHNLGQTMTYLISDWITFHVDWGQIIIRYDLIWERRVILSNVRTDSNFISNFDFGQLSMCIGANNDQI